jgi:hypothetical protein
LSLQNSLNCANFVNGDQVLTPIMGNLGITQVGVSEQHGIARVQDTIAHDYKSNNIKYAMNVNI